MMTGGNMANALIVIFSFICTIANLYFIAQWRKDEHHSRDVILQNIMGLPFLIVVAGGILFISPTDEPSLGLWLVIVAALLLPTAIGYLYYGIIKPCLKLMNNTKDPQPRLYWINIGVLLAEAVLTPLFLRLR